MQNKIKVSIVVPVYNVEKYLEKCVNSVLTQTLKDIEIICVNDGSTDSSLEILQAFAKKDARVRIISKENTGYGNTMNIGFAAAQGEYIGIVESDDYALQEMFESLYDYAKKYDVDIVKSNYYELTNSDNLCYCEIQKGINYESIYCPRAYEEIYLVPGCHIWSAIYRNDFIKKNKITFNETPGASYQDLSFTYISYLYAERMVSVKDAFLCYRIDNQSSSVKSREKVFFVMNEFQRWEKCAIANNQIELLKKTYSNKLKHYMFNYYRVDDLFKYAFILQMSKELNEANESGFLEEQYWEKNDWESIQRIRKNPVEYYQNTCPEYLDRFVLNKYAKNNEIKAEAIEQTIDSANSIIIYGAGVYGRRFYRRLRNCQSVECFAVSSKEGNPESVEGMPVFEIKDLLVERDNSLIVLCVKKTSQLSILKYLHELGFYNIITMDD